MKAKTEGFVRVPASAAGQSQLRDLASRSNPQRMPERASGVRTACSESRYEKLAQQGIFVGWIGPFSRCVHCGNHCGRRTHYWRSSQPRGLAHVLGSRLHPDFTSRAWWLGSPGVGAARRLKLAEGGFPNPRSVTFGCVLFVCLVKPSYPSNIDDLIFRHYARFGKWIDRKIERRATRRRFKVADIGSKRAIWRVGNELADFTSGFLCLPSAG